MKKIYTLFFLTAALFSKAQTTITASYISSTVVFSTGLTYITFAVRNNNSFPVILTGLTTLQANLYENNNFSLWYSVSSLGGGPTIASPVWTQIASSLQPITTTTIDQVTPFDCIGLAIPAGSTYRFALQGTKGTAVRGGVTPNIFSSGGVDLLVGNNTSTGAQVGYFGWQNIGFSGTPYFFDGSITFAPAAAYTDIEVLNIIKPSSICSATSNVLMAQVCNKSPHTINFSSTNTNVTFNVNGPVSQTATLPLTSGSLAPCGCLSAALGGFNFSLPGSYNLTATANMIGTVDANPLNNTAIDSIINYKPDVSPTVDSICQFTSGALFPGFTGSNCLPRDGFYTVNAVIVTTPIIDGSSDATAGLFAQSTLPGLPAGAVITGGKLLITNLNCATSGSFGNEARFTIYKPSLGPALPFVPGNPGSPLNFSVFNFDYSVDIFTSQLNSMYASIGAGGVFSIGYWETLDNVLGASDLTFNAQSLATQVQLIIYYTIQPNVKWFTTPSGGSSFYTGSTMNPFTLPSGLPNTNVTGNYTFYASCSADTVCRVPVVVKVKPSPNVVQDSIQACETISSSGNGLFNLNSISNVVSAFNPSATVTYYQDYNLSLLISNPANYISNTNFIYSKVMVNGCYSSDSVYLLVHPKPQFISPLMSAAVCQPDYIDAANLIDSFSTVTPGTDTLYFKDAAYTIPHPNPHFITYTDTVYILFVTSSTPACMDSAEATIFILPLNNHIVNQDTFSNTSFPGSIACTNLLLTDGHLDTLHSTIDCSLIASVFDVPNGVSLGNTQICEDIDATVQYHNGQPYVNRHYQITPSVNDSAVVCLYFLDNDLVEYNAAAFGLWPLLPTAADPSLTGNLCIAEIHNGDLNTPGHTVTSIPNTAITATYDSATTVWTLCFHVDSFSYFYLHSQNPFNIPLSVELIRFAGSHQSDNTNLLEWTTANEQNNSYFMAERSADGKTFTTLSDKINSKAPNGNSHFNLNYSFTDRHPFFGHNYYRLQQVDMDGKKHFSEVIDVYGESDLSVMLYPNPTHDLLNAEIQSSKLSTAKMKITDATGRTIRTIELSLQAGTNQTQIDLNSLVDGIYLISITDNKGLHYAETIRKK